LESSFYRASANKEGHMKAYVDNLHVKFNARIEDRLENKHAEDDTQFTRNYGDYVTRTQKLHQRL
jgi:hypothetical protein